METPYHDRLIAEEQRIFAGFLDNWRRWIDELPEGETEKAEAKLRLIKLREEIRAWQSRLKRARAGYRSVKVEPYTVKLEFRSGRLFCGGSMEEYFGDPRAVFNSLRSEYPMITDRRLARHYAKRGLLYLHRFHDDSMLVYINDESITIADRIKGRRGRKVYAEYGLGLADMATLKRAGNGKARRVFEETKPTLTVKPGAYEATIYPEAVGAKRGVFVEMRRV